MAGMAARFARFALIAPARTAIRRRAGPGGVSVVFHKEDTTSTRMRLDIYVQYLLE